MTEPRRSIRIRPRRHDVGAQLMIQFRPRGGSTIRHRRRRAPGVLHALMLTFTCVTVAILLNDESAELPNRALDRGPALRSTAEVSGREVLAQRAAPVAPAESPPTVKLSLMDDESESPLLVKPVRLSRELRVAEEDGAGESASSTSPTARHSLRSASQLGDPLRALPR